MGNQNNGGNNVGATGSEKKRNGFFGKVKKAAKSAYVWLTTSKLGNAVVIGTGAAIGAVCTKKAYDNGFKKGVASVTPTTVYITAGVDDDAEEEQEPEEESVEETAE